MNGGFCCPQGCASETYRNVCLPGPPGSWSCLEAPGNNSHPGGEEEGIDQEPLLVQKLIDESESDW